MAIPYTNTLDPMSSIKLCGTSIRILVTDTRLLPIDRKHLDYNVKKLCRELPRDLHDRSGGGERCKEITVFDREQTQCLE
jgi:hypothetical protein